MLMVEKIMYQDDGGGGSVQLNDLAKQRNDGNSLNTNFRFCFHDWPTKNGAI